MTTTDVRTITYRIDDHDRIVDIDESWLDFARQNSGEHLMRGTLLFRPLWSFISDEETRHLYRLMLSRVRSGRSMVLHMRCDSPDRRRAIELRLTPTPPDGVAFASAILHEEPRPYVALLDASAARTHDVLSICSWCKKVQVPGTGWFEVEDALERLDLTHADQLPQLAHIVCYDCHRSVIEHL